jgi:serine/threonine protein kinase
MTGKAAYAFGRALGSGRFGLVYAGTHTASGRQVAIKVLDKAALKREDCVVQLRREVEVQSRLRHPHIARVLDYFHDKARAYVVLEFCSGGELYARLQACPGKRMPEADARQVVACVASALRYCHARHVLHRDLKPENILIDGSGAVKLADFGWSVHAPEPYNARKTLCGTPEYLAPELARALAAAESGSARAVSLHGSGADMWALGCLAFELLTGATPFSEEAWLWSHPAAARAQAREAEKLKARLPRVARLTAGAASTETAGHGEEAMPVLTRRIRSAEWSLPPSMGLSEAAQAFVRGLIAIEPADRMTAAAACEHPWINEHVPSDTIVHQRVSLAPQYRSRPSSITPKSILSSALASRSKPSRAASSSTTPVAATASLPSSDTAASTASSTLAPRDLNTGGSGKTSTSTGPNPPSRARPRIRMGKAVRVAPGSKADE